MSMSPALLPVLVSSEVLCDAECLLPQVSLVSLPGHLQPNLVRAVTPQCPGSVFFPDASDSFDPIFVVGSQSVSRLTKSFCLFCNLR